MQSLVNDLNSRMKKLQEEIKYLKNNEKIENYVNEKYDFIQKMIESIQNTRDEKKVK